MIKLSTFRSRNLLDGGLGFVMSAIHEGGKEAAEESKQKLEGFTQEWSNPPKFRVHVVSSRDKVELRVLTNDKRFNWVDRGTKKHRIPLRGKKKLSIRTDYKKVVMFVRHPGIKARKYTDQATETMMRFLQPRIKARMEKVLGGPVSKSFINQAGRTLRG